MLTAVLMTVNMLTSQFYDGSNLTFGKNRIQHQEFLWQYYRFDRYDTYFYEGGKEIATHVSQVAPALLKSLENKLDYVVQDRLEFIVYNTHTDFKQSNLGLIGSNQETEIGGTAKIVGRKVFLYFEGDYNSLNRQVEAGICRMIINEMLYGGDWKEVLKNSALMNFPDWYTEGLVSYYTEGWSAGIQDRVRDGVISGRYAHFNRLNSLESVYAGHSIWKYIADVFGESVIPNILYMAKINRSIESGFIFVLGLQLDALMKEHEIYYRGIFEQQSMGRKEANMSEAYVKTRKDQVYSQYKLSPNGKQAAFASNILGQYRVWIYDIEKYEREDIARRKAYDLKKAEHDKKEAIKQRADKSYEAKSYKPYVPKLHRPKKIYKAEHKLDRLVDKSFPILEWNPRGTELSFVTESRGTVYLNIYSLKEKKAFERELFGLQKVLSFDYSHDGKKLVMSGVNKGQSDIYIYHLLGNRQERLTNDNFDDLEPRFLNKSSKVVFSSNRLDDTLRLKYKSVLLPEFTDIFAMQLSDRRILERITNTPQYNETMPFQYDSLRYTYLSDRLGMNNRYVATYDSVISRVDTVIHYRYFTKEEQLTNDDRSAIEYHVNAGKKKYSVLKFIDGSYRFYYDDISSDQFSNLALPNAELELAGLDEGRAQNSPEVIVFSTDKLEKRGIDTKDYQFEEEPTPVSSAPQVVIIDDFTKLSDVVEDSSDSLIMVMPKPRNYKLNFTNDEILAQPGNSFNNVFYQNAGFGPENLTPGFDPMLQVGVSDLFEDRRIIGSVRLDLGLRDMGYGLRYDNFTKRLDKSLIFLRQALTVPVEGINILFKTHTHTLRYTVSYPFSEVFSIRGSLLGQYERSVLLATNDQTLNTPNQNNLDGGGKLELVFDNTLHKGLNLRTGIRAKAWAEYFHEYDIETETFPSFGVLGMDFRYYQQLHRDIIFAWRLAGNTSFGDKKLVSFLGGVDNWLIPTPRMDDLPVDYEGENFAYQAMVSPLRGFYRNARNGTHAAVTNAEIRFPVFKYFKNGPIRSDFVRNFQIVPFGDAGTAWSGNSPYDEDNFFNVVVDENSANGVSYQVTLRNQEDPILFGYGAGLRSRIAGYFVRADWAWGVADGRRLPREFYLSLNLDF